MTCGPLMQISPGCPVDTSFPASSRNTISVDGIGRPIDPLYSAPSNGLIVAAGDVSVSPYASTSGTPVTAFQRLATASCTAIPPPSASRNDVKSTLRNLGWLRSALNSVLTPVVAVNL